MNQIQANYKLLSEKMDPDGGLLAALYSEYVITHREMETVKAGTTFYDRNEQLLNFMRGKNEGKYRQFLEMLRATGMSELADILEVTS